MNKCIRFILCISIISGLLPLNLRAEAKGLYLSRALNNLKITCPHLYKKLTADKNISSSFCGAQVSTDEKARLFIFSFLTDSSLNPRLIPVGSLEMDFVSASTLLSSVRDAHFQSPAFDVLIPPPRHI